MSSSPCVLRHHAVYMNDNMMCMPFDGVMVSLVVQNWYSSKYRRYMGTNSWFVGRRGREQKKTFGKLPFSFGALLLNLMNVVTRDDN